MSSFLKVKLHLFILMSLLMCISITHAQVPSAGSNQVAPCDTYTNKSNADGLGYNIVNSVYASGSTVYAATASGFFSGGGLSISTDGGATFTNKTTANGLGANEVKGVYASGNTVYAATAGFFRGGGLSISTDGGATFTNKTTANGLGSNTVNGVYVTGSTVYAATNGGLSISTDGGAAFTNKTTDNGLGSNVVKGVYASGSTVYAATIGGLSISTDGGATFTNKTTANGLGNNEVRGVYASGNMVYAGTYYGGLSISTDGGATFTNKTTANGLGSNIVNGVYASGSDVYAATDGGLSISTDGGTTFINQTTANGLGDNRLNGVYASGSTVYAATYGGLSFSNCSSSACSPNTGDTTATACGSFEWYGETYTSSATPTHTFTNVGGCDSVVTLHLTVGHSNTGDTTAFACNSFSWYGTTYTASSNPTHTFTNASGCDSVVTLHLTVGYSNTGDTTAFACNSFSWYGSTYTASSNPTHTFTNVAGCDSVVTLHLTIRHSNIGDTTATVCDSFSWYGTTYTVSSSPTHTFTNASGCDSVVTLHLTISSTPVSPNLSVTQPTCSTSTGSINISSGISGLSFSINNSNFINTTGVFVNLSSGLYAIKARNSDGCVSLPASATINAPLPLPTAFSMTGGGIYNPYTRNLLPIGISNSEIGVSYQLKLNDNIYGSPIVGSGVAFNFGNFNSLGTYTVVATKLSNSCTTNLNGSAIISLSMFSITPYSQIICSELPMSEILISNYKPGTTLSWTRDKTNEITGIASNGTTSIISGSLKNLTDVEQTVTFTITGTKSQGGQTYTQTASVVVYPKPIINSQSTNLTKSAGENASFSISASGLVIGYQWQLSTNKGLTWSNVNNTGKYTGAFSNSLNVNNVNASMNGNLYRCLVKGKCSPYALSNFVKLSVR